MNKLFLVLIAACLGQAAAAQMIPHQSIEDRVIGWIKVYHFTGQKKGMQVDNRVYSANQLSICDSLANWMQASYLPKGSLGDVKKFVSEKLTLYNLHTAGKPQCYGAYAKTYFELKYNSSGKPEPMTNSHVWWAVMANGIPGDWPVRDICTPDQYYFTMPDASTSTLDENVKSQLDLNRYESIRPFHSFWIENHGSGRGKEVVILSRDNKFPFVIVTKGELLQALENAIPVYYAAEKKKITEAEQGDVQRMQFPLKNLDEKIQRYKDGLQKNRDKYRNRLGEPARTSYQPGLIDLDNNRDIFTSQYLTDPETNNTRYPVYKADPALAALCKTDRPQWILISWDYLPGDPVEQQMHDAITANFNFEYVSHFFFSPEKIKGQAYKPLHAPGALTNAGITETSTATGTNSGKKDIPFLKNFLSGITESQITEKGYPASYRTSL